MAESEILLSLTTHTPQNQHYSEGNSAIDSFYLQITAIVASSRYDKQLQMSDEITPF